MTRRLLTGDTVWAGATRTGNPGWLLVEDDRVAALGETQPPPSADDVLDLTGVNIDPVGWWRQRRYLLAVAYRLVGSLTEAEDAVQEAYLRLVRADATRVTDLRAWLSTVVSRICLDQLRSARARRERYVGAWPPEPLVGGALVPDSPGTDPADRVGLAESVRTALLVVLETLTPAERVAFVLHDVFGLPFGQVGWIAGRASGACRQLAMRARRRVRTRTARVQVDTSELDQVVAAFHTAAATGHVDTLVTVLDPDLVRRLESSPARAQRPPRTGQPGNRRRGRRRRPASQSILIDPILAGSRVA